MQHSEQRTDPDPGRRSGGARRACLRARLRAGLLAGALPASVLVAGGCRTHIPLSPELEQRIDAEASGLPSIEDGERVRATGDAVARGEVPLPETLDLAPESGLEEYVRLALERSPRIRARVRDLEALGMRVPQVTSWSDPSLSLMPPTGSMLQTAGGEVMGSVGVSQGIPLPGRMESKGKIAEQIVRVALENLRSERLEVVKDVKQAYFAYYLAHASIRVTQENLRLLERLRDVAEAKYAAGTAPQQDLLRAEVEFYDASNELITLEQQERTAVARLNVLMDRDVLADLPAPVELSPSALDARLDALLVRGAGENPGLAAWREQTRGDLESVHLAELAAWPDFSLGALWTIISGAGISPVANGQDALGLTLGLTLPIWRERIRAGVLEKSAMLLASAERYRGARNDVFFAIQDLFVRVDAAYRRAVLLRDGILPRARQTLEVSKSGYQAGEVDFTTLIDNWQRLLELTLGYHGALATLEQEVAELERVLGGEIARRATPEGAGAGADGMRNDGQDGEHATQEKRR